MKGNKYAEVQHWANRYKLPAHTGSRNLLRLYHTADRYKIRLVFAYTVFHAYMSIHLPSRCTYGLTFVFMRNYRATIYAIFELPQLVRTRDFRVVQRELWQHRVQIARRYNDKFSIDEL